MRLRADALGSARSARPAADRNGPETPSAGERTPVSGRNLQSPVPERPMLRSVRNGTGPGELTEAQRTQVLSVVSSAGQPLEGPLRANTEARLGHDFSRVRVHTDEAAHRSAVAVNAHAYTVGSHIAFRRDTYDPESPSGLELLVHEVTHVVQQRVGATEPVPPHAALRASVPGDPLEREAAASARRDTPGPAGPVLSVAHAGPGLLLQRQTDPSAPEVGSGASAGGAAPAARVVYIDANIIIQINRGNQRVAEALRQMRAAGTEIRISPFQYNELVLRPEIPRTATAQRLLLSDLNIRVGAAPTLAQRVDVQLAGQTARGGNIMQIKDQQLVASARSDGRAVQIWSLDTPFTSNARQVERTYGVRIAPESRLPVERGRADYRVGRQLLGLEPVQISLTGQVTRTAPRGPGPVPPGGAPPAPPAPTPGSSYGTGTRVAAGGLGLLVVVNEILGSVGRVRNVQQRNIDMGEAHLAFWEKFGAKPVPGVWDQNSGRPLPRGSTPQTSVFGSPSYPYVVDIDVAAFERTLPERINGYQDFLHFLDAARTLGTIQEEPPMPHYPTPQQRDTPRRYYAWVNVHDRVNRRMYDVSGVIDRVRRAALGELSQATREQAQSLSPEQQAGIHRLKHGPETRIYRSAGGGQVIRTSQQVFGPDPWVRVAGPRKDVGGWFSKDIRVLVVPANADAQRSALVSGYWVKQPIEDTFEEVEKSGRPILDRQPSEGPLTSFVAGPEPGARSRFGETRYYRHSDPNVRWTVALGELREFWVKAEDLEPLPPSAVRAYTGSP